MAKLNPAIAAAVEDAVSAAAANPGVPIAQANKLSITTALVDHLASDPVVLNETNSEPWYQSRVVLGSVAAIITSSFAIVAAARAGISDGEVYAPLVMTIVGSGFALYGRLRRSLLPIGRKA